MTWRVILFDQVQAYIDGLDDDDKREVLVSIRLLRELGPNLGRPRADQIKSSRHKNMKELRASCGDRQHRIFFAFDPERKAILLIGGDKVAHGVDAFYKELIPKADALFDEHLAAASANENVRAGRKSTKSSDRKKRNANRRR